MGENPARRRASADRAGGGKQRGRKADREIEPLGLEGKLGLQAVLRQSVPLGSMAPALVMDQLLVDLGKASAQINIKFE